MNAVGSRCLLALTLYLVGCGSMRGYYGDAPAGLQLEVLVDPVAVARGDPQETAIKDFAWVWDDVTINPGRYLLYAGLGERGESETAEPVTIELTPSP
jgi:hypothetical protein